MNVTPYFGLGFTGKPFKFKDMQKCVNTYMDYMLLRTINMFTYSGLPDTIPSEILETYLQINGLACVFEHNGELYATFGGWGGEPNEYYIPTQFIVANPYLNVFETFTDGESCVVMKNDSLYKGLNDMFRRYATQLATNDISINLASINSRIVALIDAPDDRTRESAEQYLQKVARGDLGVVASNAFLDGVRTQPYGGTSDSLIKTLIELHQYIKASWFNEIGLEANYNMKREALSEAEGAMNDDVLVPLVDDMLRCRQEAVKKINELFGTNITVELASAWKDNEEEREVALESMVEPEQEPEPEQEDELEPTEDEQEGNDDDAED